MLKEFKQFCMRGNVVDMAVGVIIGAAFGSIVTALVNNILMPAIGILVGGVDFSSLSFTIGTASIGYGAFIQAVIDFVIVAFCVFLFIKGINKLTAIGKKKEEAKEEAPAAPTEAELLAEIRDLLKAQNENK